MQTVAFRNKWPLVGMVWISKCYSHYSNVITNFADTKHTHTHTHIYIYIYIYMCVYMLSHTNCVCFKGQRIYRFINFCFINNVVSSFMYAGDNRNVLDSIKFQRQGKYGLQSSY
jgi:hypothetical protein